MPKRLITRAEQRHLEALVEVCFALEADLERREAVSALYDTAEAASEEIVRLSAARAELKALLEKLSGRLP